MEHQGKLNKNNRGFSLVEIVIVIAIISVIGGIAGFGISMISGKPAEECARKLASAISHGRTVTLGKYGNEITIKKESDEDGGRLVVTEHTVISVDGDGNETDTSDRSSVVGSKGVTVEYKIGTSDSYTELTPGSSIELRYDSGSGAMKKTANGGADYYTGFRISKGGKVWNVTLQPLTGNITVDKGGE